ncbi:hypothetical protein Moror_454 [Moniliophthora roreri MCA 2997]|uniref:AAA+ ATPase domain-containing protein n=2 Tax=Moniliophthora roreri TaxID=221103 RepID=V2XFN8_MONRO|nr:hypothetical protein Moror_454 [Moniliophthora roreri MCA 2997]
MSSVSRTNGNHPRLRKAPSQPTNRHAAIGSMHWLFRTNIPRRRASYIQPDIRRRNFFGMSEIIGVLTNPAETVRSLAESKRLLEEARREINETRERAQIRPKHTFSPLPDFHPRNAELKAIERVLDSGEPNFTVLFGASSVGKTALLREVLCRDKYHVLHFDLRIAGFADLASLYTSLSQQMEQYFEEISKQEGFEEFEKESWSFKHDRLNVERRLQDSPPDSGIQRVKTSDIARLMELFQSSLLKYREFKPNTSEGRNRREDSDANSDRTHVNTNDAHPKKKWRFRKLMRGDRNKNEGRATHEQQANGNANPDRGEERRYEKKMPVIFFDEAHKLPALIQSAEAMNCLLSTFLVLTKQDRLCHVIHATSDPFYHTWLRQLNVMQHCKIITIGDCSKSETRAFFRERIIPTVPDDLRPGLSFERLYEAFGGKLVHWQDYVADYVNSNGNLEIKQSSHFLQAHALLNLHIIHSSQAPHLEQDSQPTPNISEPPLASRSASGFRIYSPITNPSGPHGSAASITFAPSEPLEFTAMQLLKVMSRITQPGVDYIPYFMLCREFGVKAVDGMVKGRVLDLRWTEVIKGEESQAEDVEVRESMGIGDGVRLVYGPGDSRPGSVPGYMNDPIGMGLAGSSATAVEEMFGVRPPPPMSPPPAESDEDMVAVSEREAMLESLRRQPSQRQPPPPNSYLNDYPPRPSRHPRRSTYHPQSQYNDPYASLMEVVGPKLVPVTPIMRYAMREVVSEYQEDDDDVEDGDVGDEDTPRREGEGSRRRTATGTDADSEYASLSEVEEY